MKTKRDKREEAEERQAYWSKFTDKQELEDLDRRLGEGVGSRKQRARLREKINDT